MEILPEKDEALYSSLPEAHGMDSERLRRMMDVLVEWKIKDVVVVRNGALIWKWHDRDIDRLGAVFSCTKSVLSAIVGIVVDEGLLQLDQPISDFFEGFGANDVNKNKITVRHLLTMTPGFEWPEFDKPYFNMRKTKDWIGFITKQPLAHEPGEVYTYNSGCSHLLSSIVTKLTGKSAFQFGQERLFDKLGFHKVKWNHASGISEGGAGMHMMARDLAKLGQLYLQQGKWNEEQLISKNWIRESTEAANKGLSNYKPPIYGNYGYHWWNSTAEYNGWTDFYFALGYGGQYLFVIPEFQLVVVVRKAVDGKNNAILSKNLLFEHIAHSIQE
ncbi:serine hydrolase domain-containing protein [Paenibacillus abyssi]|uniref:Serine hydrolase n=1 Tax=Paenibacillus abyssi TaxID=1340531 RepID=A0A917D579_9BACL|nr:serine hydrolase [Paenibacillus abyssi]GGG11420.1 serine hydrolase [Paenibacillus abyssi]